MNQDEFYRKVAIKDFNQIDQFNKFTAIALSEVSASFLYSSQLFVHKCTVVKY